MAFEAFGQPRHQSEGEGQQFDGMDGGNGGLLFHLHTARTAVSSAGDSIDCLHGLHHVATDSERRIEVLGSQSEGSGHTGAAFFEFHDFELWNEPEQLGHGDFTFQCSDVTGRMPRHLHGQGREVPAELTSTMQIQQETSGIVCLFSHGFCIL